MVRLQPSLLVRARSVVQCSPSLGQDFPESRQGTRVLFLNEDSKFSIILILIELARACDRAAHIFKFAFCNDEENDSPIIELSAIVVLKSFER